MGPATKTVLALVATLVLLEPGQARRAPASATRADAADDSEPPMVTETDPKYRIPEKLLIGVGSASYQTEGAWDKDGKGESVFDHYYHNNNFAVNMTGDVACNSYERYEEDIKLAAELNFNIYRFSIAWTRIFPDGDTSKKNEKGVQHYHNVIKAIKAHNMKPVVTLYHFDHPQALEDKFKGWLGDEMIKSFADYADFVFAEYGKEVEYWLTINEPNMHCLKVYNGGLAPGVPGANYTAADVYKCIHNEILAHTAAYRLYERKYRQDQGGRVGFGAVTFFSRPNSTQWDDILAAERTNMFDVGMVVHPLVFGDYPDVVKETLTRAGKQDHLPVFSKAQKQDVKGAVDFIGLNAYYGMTVADPNKGGVDPFTEIYFGRGPHSDCNVTVLAIGDNKDPDPNNSGFANVFGQINAWILRDIALWIKSRFGSGLALFVMENGMASLAEQSLDDWETRAVYHSAYLREMVRTINEDDVNYIGYAVWSLLNDFEWSSGYGRRFGIVHVDYERGTLDRTLKRSHHFFKRMMKDGSVPLVQAAAAPPSAAGSGSSTALHSALAVTLAAALSLLNRDSAM